MERLLAESLEDVSADPTEGSQLLLELYDSQGDESSDQSRRAVKADIDLRVRHINGFGKLRWSRSFDGVAIKRQGRRARARTQPARLESPCPVCAQRVRSFDSSGGEAQHVYVGTAYDHMLPRDFADTVERLGRPRPPLPVGLDVIEALDGGAVTALAASNPVVARVLHL